MKLNQDSNSWENAERKALRIKPDLYLLPIQSIDRNLSTARYSVRGSRRNLYSVIFWEDSQGNFNHQCNCIAGSKHYVCYHVVAAWLRHCFLVENRFRPNFNQMKREVKNYV